jgi:hypothetical protein
MAGKVGEAAPASWQYDLDARRRERDFRWGPQASRAATSGASTTTADRSGREEQALEHVSRLAGHQMTPSLIEAVH